MSAGLYHGVPHRKLAEEGFLEEESRKRMSKILQELAAERSRESKPALKAKP